MNACHDCTPTHNRDVRDYGRCWCPCHSPRPTPPQRKEPTMTTPDEIWHSLSPAAKASWVAAMMPEPTPTPAPPLTAEQVEAIVTEYVRRVRANTNDAAIAGGWNARQNVLDAIRHHDRYEIADEMAQVAHDLGYPYPDGDDEGDAYMDQLYDTLDDVAARLTTEGSLP